MNKEARVSMNLFLLLIWAIFFPVFCYFIYQYVPFGSLGDFSKNDKLAILILTLLFYFGVMNSLHNSTQIDDDIEIKIEKEEKEIMSKTFFILLETKIIGGKIFTFSADFPKLPVVGEVLVVYSEDESDYVELTVTQVSMATNLPNEEGYLVKGDILPSGQEKLEVHGWEEK